MSELDQRLAGQSLADYTNKQLRLALGAVLYTNTADMWSRYLKQCGYSGALANMLQRYYADYNVPAQFRNYINAGAYLESRIPVAGDYLLDALNGNYLTDELSNRLTA